MKRCWPLLVAFILLVGGVFFNFGPNTTFFANDQALSFSVVEHGLRGEIPLAGPPSHVGGRHLGPFYYWYLMATQLIGGGLHGGIFAGAVVFSIAILTIGWVVGGPGGALVAAMLGVSGYLDTIRIPWHPHILLILNAIFIFCTGRLFERGLPFLGWWCFWGSILAQTHSAAVPFTVGVACVVGIWVAVQVKGGDWGQIISGRLGWVFTFFSFLPLFCYNVFYDPNLARLFQAHSEEVVGAGFKLAGLSLYDFVGQHVLGVIWGRSLGAVALGLVFLILFVESEAREKIARLVTRRSWVLTAVLSGVLLTLCALSRFKAPIYEYYWSVILPVPFIIGAWCAGSITVRSRLGFSAVVVLGVLIGYADFRAVRRYADRPFVAQHTLGSAEQVVGAIRRLAGDATGPGELQILTRLYASSMKNTYNFLLDIGRFNQLEVSYKFKEFSDAPDADVVEGGYQGRLRAVVFCPAPYSKELKRMMSGFRKKWAMVGEEMVSGVGSADRCLIRLLSRRDEPHRALN